MRTTRRELLGTAAASVAIAGCTGDGGGGTDPTETPADATDSPGDAPGDGSDATVQVRSHPDHGEILVGSNGLSLYMFDQDENGAGESACYDDCAESWPPLTVDDDPIPGDGVSAELTTFERDDESTQVAANGWPLYFFDSDEEPGDVAGQGVGDVWWVLDPAGEPIRPDAENGETATEEGATPTETETTTTDEGSTATEDDGGDGGGYYGLSRFA